MSFSQLYIYTYLILVGKFSLGLFLSRRVKANIFVCKIVNIGGIYTSSVLVELTFIFAG